MEWSGQQSQVPQHAPQPVAGPEPIANYYGASPLQGPAAAATPPHIAMPGAAGAMPSGQPQINPIGAPPALTGQVAAMPPMSQSPAAVQLDDNVSDVDDAEWVKRAKRAIGGTHGDPHRQIQLIQHLRSQYLKQRFGRTVHTDEA
jgi:hypothetical protein